MLDLRAPDGSATTAPGTPESNAALARLLAGLHVARPRAEKPRVALSTGPVRVAAYVRYSSHMQDGNWSIAAQVHQIEKEGAERGNWSITVYEERARSAYEEELAKRPTFLRMLRDAFAGQIDLIVVHKLDRFSRKMKVTLLVLEELERQHIDFLSLAEQQFDTTTPVGWLGLNLSATIAHYFSLLLGAEIRKGKAERALSGLHGCRVPFGYRWMGEKDACVPDMREDGTGVAQDGTFGTWTGLQAAYGWMREGLTDTQVATRLNAGGWRLSAPSKVRGADGSLDVQRSFTRVSVSRLRRSVFYRAYAPGDTCGTVVYRGQEHRGQHPAAIGYQEWQTLQTSAGVRRGHWQGVASGRLGIAYTAEFRGIAVCASCGGRLYVRRAVHKPSTPDERVYESYVCSASDTKRTCSDEGRYARVEDVRAAWVNWLVEHLEMPEDAEARIRQYTEQVLRQEGYSTLSVVVGECGSEGAPDDTARTKKREQEVARWEEKKRRALHAWVHLDLSDAEHEQLRQEADAALARLAAEAATPETVARRTAWLVNAAEICTDLADLWPQMTTEERIQVASLLIEPRGLMLRVSGARPVRQEEPHPRPHRRPRREKPMTCEIVAVRLREDYRELVAALESGRVIA